MNSMFYELRFLIKVKSRPYYNHITVYYRPTPG